MTEQEAKKKAEEFLNSLSPEQFSELQDEFKKGFDNLIQSNIDKLNELKAKKSEYEEIKKTLIQPWNPYNPAIYAKKDEAGKEIYKLERLIQRQENVVKSLENGGSIISVTDEHGFVYESIPDFRKVDTSEFNFEEETILSLPVPKYVPVIDISVFETKGFVFDSIRVTEDSYLISINGYREKKEEKEKNSFVVVTLDQLVLIIDYYFTKLKAEKQAEADRKTKRAEEYYDSLSEEQRKRYVFQIGFYKSLPVAVKKKISEADYEKLNLQEREALYKPFKRYGAKRLTAKLSEDYMWTSFHRMYEDFINKEATLIEKVVDGRKKTYANPIVSKYWADFREMVNFKIKDIKIQREDYSESYKQAIETSFGESNVDAVLKDKLGILIKRQNGEKIKINESSQIENAWLDIQKVYGNLKENALKYNLKISHSADKLIFASKALGVFVPKMGTIAVSNKLGDIDFKSTFAHESAHFIDYFIGELNGKRWATDDYEALAGKIAFTFRNSMNRNKKEQSDYINATKECFARCFQQYFAVKTGNLITKNVEKVISEEPISFYKHPNFVNEETFNNVIVPMIEQFLKENLIVFETTIDANEVNDPVQIVESNVFDEKQEWLEALDSLNLLLNEGGTDAEIAEWKEGIESLNILLK